MSSNPYVQDLIRLETLFKRFYKPLRAYAFRFVNDKELSEDIIQDVFYELWQRRTCVRFEDMAIKSYLFQAVYTHSLNTLRKKRTNICRLEPEKETDIPDQYITSHMYNTEQNLLLKELEKEITAFIDTLPPQCHKIFVLSRNYGLKNQEIADQLKISIKAVEKQITKALYGLKEHLEKRELFSFLIGTLASFYS